MALCFCRHRARQKGLSSSQLLLVSAYLPVSHQGLFVRVNDCVGISQLHRLTQERVIHVSDDFRLREPYRQYGFISWTVRLKAYLVS